jgi:hypothetical protein
LIFGPFAARKEVDAQKEEPSSEVVPKIETKKRKEIGGGK